MIVEFAAIVEVYSSFSFVALREKNTEQKRKIQKKEEEKKNTLFFIPSPSTIVDFVVVKAVRHCNQQEKKNKN